MILFFKKRIFFLDVLIFLVLDAGSMNYPKPSITCDSVVYRGTSVLLIKRRNEPYKGFWAFPGGFFNPIDSEYGKQDNSLLECALRELEEETNLSKNAVEYLSFPTKILDNPERDCRGRVVSFVFYFNLKDGYEKDIKAKDDAVEIDFVEITDILCEKVKLAFDHKLAFD